MKRKLNRLTVVLLSLVLVLGLMSGMGLPAFVKTRHNDGIW